MFIVTITNLTALGSYLFTTRLWLFKIRYFIFYKYTFDKELWTVLIYMILPYDLLGIDPNKLTLNWISKIYSEWVNINCFEYKRYALQFYRFINSVNSAFLSLPPLFDIYAIDMVLCIMLRTIQMKLTHNQFHVTVELYSSFTDRLDCLSTQN